MVTTARDDWTSSCVTKQKVWAEAVHLAGVSSSSTSGLGYYLVQALASSFGGLPMGSTGPRQSIELTYLPAVVSLLLLREPGK